MDFINEAMAMSETEPIITLMLDYEAITGTSNSGFVADFSSADLQRPSERIADNINTIIHGIKALNKMMKLIGGPNDSVELRQTILDVQNTVKGSIMATPHDLKQLRTAVRCGNKLEELHELRLNKDFREACTKFSSVKKQISKKMLMHLPKLGGHWKDHLQAMERQAIEDDQNARLIELQLQESLSEGMRKRLENEKQARIHLEAQVRDIYQYFIYLAERVQSQSILIDSIDGNIEHAREDVEAGGDQIERAAIYRGKYSKKMFIIIIALLIITVICIMFILN